jgi:hypothetical protein
MTLLYYIFQEYLAVFGHGFLRHKNVSEVWRERSDDTVLLCAVQFYANIVFNDEIFFVKAIFNASISVCIFSKFVAFMASK